MSDKPVSDMDLGVAAAMRMQVEIDRLTAELANVTANYQTYVDGVDHAMDEEVKRLSAGILAASHLIKAATGPEGGPTSWPETAKEWLATFRRYLLTEDELLHEILAEAAKGKT